MTTTVLSAAAENATRLVRRQQAVLQRRVLDRGLQFPIVGRIMGWTLADLADVGPRASIPLHVSVGEEFQRRRLIEFSSVRVPANDRMLTALWTKAERDHELSWDRQIDAWKSWHAVEFKQQGWWDRFNGFIHARNALMHGLGSLTPKQLRDRQNVVSALTAAGIQLGVGDVIVVGDQQIKDCADVVCALIAWLDGVAPEP